MAAYTEQVEETTVVGSDGDLNIRTVIVVYRDGVRFSEGAPLREAVLPGEIDPARHSARAQAIATAVWTPQVRKLWDDRKAASVAAIRKPT